MSSNIPRRLERRDPNRPEDRFEALRIIQEIAGIRVLASTRDELAAVGVPLPRAVKVTKRLRADDWAIGVPFSLERGLIVSDNVILTCSECRGAIQYRPHLAHASKRHLCVFCAADKLLQAYWKGRSTAEP